LYLFYVKHGIELIFTDALCSGGFCGVKEFTEATSNSTNNRSDGLTIRYRLTENNISGSVTNSDIIESSTSLFYSPSTLLCPVKTQFLLEEFDLDRVNLTVKFVLNMPMAAG